MRRDRVSHVDPELIENVSYRARFGNGSAMLFQLDLRVDWPILFRETPYNIPYDTTFPILRSSIDDIESILSLCQFNYLV